MIQPFKAIRLRKSAASNGCGAVFYLMYFCSFVTPHLNSLAMPSVLQNAQRSLTVVPDSIIELMPGKNGRNCVLCDGYALG